MKQVKRYVKQICVSITMMAVLFVANIHPVMAQEINNDSENRIFSEFEDKKEAGFEVYELLDENGNFMGYYEPYSEANPEPVKTTRFTNTKVTNGWNGTITFSGISTAVYSFGIENASSSTITYSGSYTL